MLLYPQATLSDLEARILSGPRSAVSACEWYEWIGGLAPADGKLCLEFGVWQGNSARLIARSVRKLYAFDSFEGLPEPWKAADGKVMAPAGWFRTQRDKVVVPPNVEVVKGLFADTLPAFMAEHRGDVGFVHVDCDLYSSTKLVLGHLANRLCVGSILVFDEIAEFFGVTQDNELKALHEFMHEHSFLLKILRYNKPPDRSSGAAALEVVDFRPATACTKDKET